MLAFNSKPISNTREAIYNQSITTINVPMEPYNLLY